MLELVAEMDQPVARRLPQSGHDDDPARLVYQRHRIGDDGCRGCVDDDEVVLDLCLPDDLTQVVGLHEVGRVRRNRP